MNESEMMRPMDKKDKVLDDGVTAGGSAGDQREEREHADMSIVWKTALLVMLVGALIAILFL